MSDGDPDFDTLLEYLRRTRGFNFAGYKRTTLSRRINKRMHGVGVEGYADYVDFLEVHPEEFDHLFDTILINVTGFFRDPLAWDALVAEAIPEILARKGPTEPIRIWSAGSASGEEAYTLAMVLAEALGPDQVRRRVKIYGTDVDEDALARARAATYDARQVEAIPPALLEKYFDRLGGDGTPRYVVQKDIRRLAIFGRNDLVQDAPISRIDLLACRNTLMYFNQEAQTRILGRFHFALHDGGALFLGKAETLLMYNSLFAPIDLKRRVFAKVPKGARARPGPAGPGTAGGWVGQGQVREAAFDHSLMPQLVVDFGGLIVLANDRARAYFGLGPADIGRPLQDHQVSYRPADLRSCIDLAYKERRPTTLREVEASVGPAQVLYFDVHVVPLLDPGGGLLGVSIGFIDVTAAKRLKDEVQTSRHELEAAYEELQSTVEELETTNEELQSTVEELETTNEELHSTNEELETMNEELQSSNDELEQVDEQRRAQGDELKRVNTDLRSILDSLRVGVAVVDPEMRVRVWNPRAEDLWGLRAEEVREKNLLALEIGLPVERLGGPLRACLAGRASPRDAVLDAVDRRGRPIECRVTFTPLGDGDTLSGAILLMEELATAGAPAAADHADGDGARP